MISSAVKYSTLFSSFHHNLIPQPTISISANNDLKRTEIHFPSQNPI